MYILDKRLKRKKRGERVGEKELRQRLRLVHFFRQYSDGQPDTECWLEICVSQLRDSNYRPEFRKDF